MIMRKVIQKISIVSIWIVLLLLSSNLLMAQDTKGLLPVNKDGFETGDWRNFRPHYAGDATEWTRPAFSINRTEPISGNYSLQWKSDDRDQQWFMLSNAFYLERPVKISVDFQVTGKAKDFEAGLLLMESKEVYAGIKVSRKKAALFKKGNTTVEQPKTGITILPGTIYHLTVSISADGVFKAEVTEKVTGRLLSGFESLSFIAPEALSMYVKTGRNSNTDINFDNMEIQAADYKVAAGKYVRAPQFVVLPRTPDVEQDQGNWVGGHASIAGG